MTDKLYHRVEFLVADEDVGRTLRSLAGAAFDLKVEPVINLKSGRAGRSIPETSGYGYDLYLAHLRKTKASAATYEHARQFLLSIGKSPANAGNVIKKLVGQGHLRKRSKTRNAPYDVIN